MFSETPANPRQVRRPNDGKPAGLICDRPSWGLAGDDRRDVPTSGFTLIELLTVITIIAILATLLMTTFGSVKRKAREAVCTSNLHQIGIALHLYLDDYGQRPPGLELLASSKYLGDGKVLTCPADRSINVIPAPEVMDTKSAITASVAPSDRPIHVSYQHPLAWSDEAWDKLMQAGTRAGVVVCTFHDVHPSKGVSNDGSLPDQGLVLRGLLDGTVVRRLVFPEVSLVNGDSGVTPTSNRSSAPPSAFAAAPGDAAASAGTAPTWKFFSDEPPPEN